MQTNLSPGLLILLTRLSLSSGAVYVRRGSDITDCSMNCPHRESVLEVYRVCGDDESNLLELWCDSMWSYNRLEPRLHLNTSSGCWTLTDAGEDDSCVYNVLYHRNGGSSRRSIHIIVLDPVLISNITSNSSRLGQDIAVSVQFSGEEAAVTWEVDGGPVPDRYRLIDDNRTMIIPSAQIDDAGRRLHVRITNPVSEETREYQLEITGSGFSRFPSLPGVSAAVGMIILILVIVIIVLVMCHKKKKLGRAMGMEDTSTPKTQTFPETKRRDKKNLSMWRNLWNISKYKRVVQRDRGGVEMADNSVSSSKENHKYSGGHHQT
ncbi:uncharacterized protein RB166_002938 isoform 2-T2 [Leptodactylus fuscus]|uniref:uncharacterized protein LOC142194290 isoform X2 n=1 Tax=Leptodactylus fuscus TaxID=238119 RepID=UPI003F4F3861